MAAVRRIKRKKSQTRTRKTKWIWWSLAGFFAVLMIGVFSMYFYVRAYLQSEEFVQTLEQAAVDDLNVSDATIELPTWEGAGVQCPMIQMSGPELLKTLKARRLSAEFERWALLNRRFIITSLNLAELEIALNGGGKSFQFHEKPEEEKTWVERHIAPDEFRLKQGRVDSFSFTFAQQDKQYSLKNSALDCVYEHDSDLYTFQLRGGTLKAPFAFCPDLNLKTGEIHFVHANKKLSVPTCRFTVNSGGYIELKGEWDIEAKNAWAANLVINNIPLNAILTNNWLKHVQGNISGGLDLGGQDDESLQVAGIVRIQDGIITGVPMLDQLSLFCDTTRFRQLVLHKASAKFRYSNRVWHIQDIVLESENLLRVQGHVEIGEDQALSGRLQIGLPAKGLWQLLPGFSDVFLPAKGKQNKQMVWANINLSGTLEVPKEDLSSRLVKALGQRTIGKIVEHADTVGDVMKSLLGVREDQTQKQDAKKEQGERGETDDEGATDDGILPSLQKATEQGVKDVSGDLLKRLLN